MAKKALATKAQETETSSLPVVIDNQAVMLKMQAARVVASQNMPYLSVALFAMTTIRVDSLFVNGQPTLATDDKWRLYYNPLAVVNWSVDQLAGVLLHEVGHCLRAHSNRFTNLNEKKNLHSVWNIAGDALINTDLREDKIPLPGKPYYMETLKEIHQVDATREMTTEQIYFLLRDKQEENCSCGKGKSDNKDGEKKGEDQGSGEGQQGEGQDQGEGSGTDPNCPVHGSHQHGEGGEPCDCDPTPDCGSITDGIRRDYEAEGEKTGKGVDEARADLVRQHVAVEIKNHVKNRGNVPAGLARWAVEFTEPVIDWKKELSFIIRKTFAQVSGKRDYTYRKTSRRQSAMNQSSGNTIILPAMYQPAPPKISIVIDTSGSMSDDMLSWALAETKGVLRSLGSSARGMKVISCDAQASTQKVTKVADITLSGGGGTDMRVGIAEAMKNRQDKPDAVIVITDGYTPWPSEPLQGAILIVALTAPESAKDVPSWARKVLITRDEPKSRKQ